MKSFEILKKEFEEITSIIDIEKQKEILNKFFKIIYPDIKNINYKRKVEDIVQCGIIHITNFKKDMRKSYDREFRCYTGTRGKRGISNFNDYTNKFLAGELNLMYSIPYNSYYSLGLHRTYIKDINEGVCFYNYDYEFDRIVEQELKKEAKRKNRKYNLRHFRATKKNTVFLGIVAIDIDAATKEKLEVQINKVNEIEKILGVSSLRINTSKKGQQRIYLLDKLYTDKSLQYQFTKAFYEAGANIDTKIIDSSRLLRLPCSIHTKAFCGSEKHQEFFIVEWENSDEDFERYNPYILIEKLNSLKIRDYIDKDDRVNEKVKEIIKEKKEKDKKKYDFNVLREEVRSNLLSEEKLQEIYNCIDITEVPEPIKLMLSHIPIGFRNIGMRAVNYFLEFDYPFQITENNKRYVLVELSRRLDDIDLLYQANYLIDNKQYVKLSKENDLIKLFGRYEHSIRVGKAENIMLSNMLITSFKYLKGKTFETFLNILIYEAEIGIKEEYTKNELVEITKMTDKSMERYLKNLVNAKLIIKKKAKNRKNGELTKFYINPRYRDINLGYEKIGLKHMEMIMEKLNSNELKLYCYFLLKVKGDEEFRRSQTNIAKDLDLDQTSISKLTNKLSKMGFLIKETEGNGFFKTSKYKIR
jgi:predicted transcriptional regulator